MKNTDFQPSFGHLWQCSVKNISDELSAFVMYLSSESLIFLFFGNNEPGAVGTTRWWPPGIALQKRRFSKKDGKIKRKNPCPDVSSKPDGMKTMCAKISL